MNHPRKTTPLVASVVRFALLAAIALMAGGCKDESLSLEERIDLAESLPGIRASRHSELRAEFRLVEQSQSLPEQLDRDAVPTHKNAAVALAKLFEDDDDGERVASINDQASAFLGAVGPGDAEFITVEAATLADRWLQPIAQVAKLTEMEECDFGLRYSRGYFNDVRFLDRSGAACRLLLVDALANLEVKPEQAMAQFALAWRWIDWLSAERHLESRLKAAELRADAFTVAEQLANRPQATRQNLLRLQQLFSRSLTESPSVEETLLRERAIALVTYEAIRLGLVNLLFTEEEREVLKTTEVLESLQKASPDRIDADEAAYLAYMHHILDTAGEPFHTRTTGLWESDRLLASTAAGDEYAWFANRLFAENLTLAQAELARDQSRLEGWVLALAGATQSPTPALKISPLNGKPYVAMRKAGAMVVNLQDRRSINPRVVIPQR